MGSKCDREGSHDSGQWRNLSVVWRPMFAPSRKPHSAPLGILHLPAGQLKNNHNNEPPPYAIQQLLLLWSQWRQCQWAKLISIEPGAFESHAAPAASWCIPRARCARAAAFYVHMHNARAMAIRQIARVKAPWPLGSVNGTATRLAKGPDNSRFPQDTAWVPCS